MNATQSIDASAEAPTFDALTLSDEVRRALDEVGYVKPTPVQLATYDVAISGRDIIVQARTGTGKTAAFAIPLVDKLIRAEPKVQALVLAPTRELALQSAKEIARLGKYRDLRTAAVYGGAPMGRQIDELAAGAQIVSGTPGRVLDHLRRGTLDASALRVLILDEMDEMLSMGFARELNAILELIPEAGKRQTMCFSATVDGEIRRHAERYMRDPQMISLSSDAVGAEAISHHVYMVSGRDRTADLVQILEVEDPESAIIFCNLRSETEQVAGSLKQAGFNADWLNGDLPQRDREKVMSRTREGKLRYLVATDVAARGIDVSHLTHVINYTFPESPAAYVHRTGRTGRAGRTGCAISLVSPTELGRLYYLRLEYKILPIERALPSRGELRTRKEADRVALLSEAFPSAARGEDLALARRLLTHPDAERIIGGLLQTFFGTRGEAVDEEAAAARRARSYPVPGATEDEAPKTPVRGYVRSDAGAVDAPRGGATRPDASRGGAPRADAIVREPGRSGPGERSDRTASAENADGSQGRREHERSRRERGRRRDRGERGDEPRARAAEGARDSAQSAESRERGVEATNGSASADAPRAHDAEAMSEPTPSQEPHARAGAVGDPTQAQTARRKDEPRHERRGEKRPARGGGGRDAAHNDADAPTPEVAEPAAPARARARTPERASQDGDARRGETRAPRPRRQAEGRPRKPSSAQEGPLHVDELSAAREGAERDATAPAEQPALLYLDAGRRDGVAVGHVEQLLCDVGELDRAAIGRIQLRERHTLVDVPEDRVEALKQKLQGQRLGDKVLSPERAKMRG